MNRKDQLVIVLTRSYATGVGVVRALGTAGYTVDMIASARKAGMSKFASKSKYINYYEEVVSAKFHVTGETDRELLDALLKYKGRYEQKPVLFPTDDYTASIIDGNRSLLGEIFLMPGICNGEEGSLVSSMDKTFQSGLARKSGILTPKEWIISLNVNEIEVPQDIVYPCFVKPVESVNGYKREMAVCRGKRELRTHLLKLKRRNRMRDILIQEYLKIEREIDLSGVCIDQNIIIPAIIRKTRVAKYEKGVTLSGMLYPFEDMEPYCAQIVDMMRRFHYIGMFDMEFFVANGEIYFNEVNFRSGGPHYSYFVSGANLPAIFVDEITGHSHLQADEAVDRFGLNFIYEKVAWEDYLKGYMSKSILKRRISDADFRLLYSKDDPAPYKFFIKDAKRQEFEKNLSKHREKIKNSKIVVWFQKIKKSKLIVSIKNKILLAKAKLLRYPQLKKKNRRSKFNNRPRVLVAGRNYSTNISIARSVGEAGYSVEVMRVYQTMPGKREWLRRMKPDRYSKYVKAYYVAVTDRSDLNLKREFIRVADKKHKMLIIPADDLVASVVDKYYDDLKKYYILPNVADKQGEINYWMKKGVQKELFRKTGLPILNSCVITADHGRFEIPDSVKYPCFIKPEISRYAAKSRMHKCDTREELEGWLTVFSEKNETAMLVEDYVEIDKEYSILGVSTRNGVIAPAAFVAVRGGQKEHRGVALTGKILDLQEIQPIADQIVKVIENLEFEGLFDIDLIEAKNGDLYVIEMNLRLGASGYAFTKCGVNLPGIFADYMIYHKPVDHGMKIHSSGETFVSEKVLLDEYAGGRINKGEIKQIMRMADIFFIKSKEDAAVWRYFRKYLFLASFLRKEKKDVIGVADMPLEERLQRVNTRAVASVMKKAFWNEEKALAEMKSAKDKFGVSFVSYDYRNLWSVPSDGLAEYLIEQEKLRQLRERFVASVMVKTGWKYEKAARNMKRAKQRLGVTYLTYDTVNLWRIPEADQKKYLRRMQQTGCTEAEYFRYKFDTIPAKTRNSIFLNSTSNELCNRYNVDEKLDMILEDREKLYTFFRICLKRPWCVNTKVSSEQFVEYFENCSRLVYKPFDHTEADEIAVFEVSAYNALAVYRALSAMAPGIVEECLKQHSELEKLAPRSMTKLIIVTVSSNTVPVTVDGKTVEIAYAVLRVGSEEVQNQFYDGALMAAVNLETGCLETSASDINCKKYTSHPVSKTRFKGFEIPMFEEAKNMIEQVIAAKRLEGYLEWELVITERGPRLVTVNNRPAAVLLSAPYAVEGRGKKSLMKKYLWNEYGEVVNG